MKKFLCILLALCLMAGRMIYLMNMILKLFQCMLYWKVQ